MILKLLLISFYIAGGLCQHRSPPGVNPQHYEGNQQYQAPPNPQYQQQAQHQQQQQYAQGNVGGSPQYQQQAQVPRQQPQQNQPPPPPPQQQYQPPPPSPPQQAGGHQPHGHHQQKVLHASNLKDESAHIKDHLDVPLDTSRMSEQELQYHYFKMHDADNNNKLDGQELIKSLFHWHDSANHDPKKGESPEHKIFSDNDLVNMIDPILEQDDRNRDGFIDYPEFVQAQRNAAAAAPPAA